MNAMEALVAHILRVAGASWYLDQPKETQMPKQKRRSDRASFAMTDEVRNTHAPKRSHPHLLTEVMENPNRTTGLAYQLTFPLTPFAHRCLSIAPIDPRSAQQQ